MVDEITSVAIFMAHAMNTNAHGSDCQRMAELNRSFANKCISDYFKATLWRRLFGALAPQQCVDIEISNRQAALLMWALKVMQNSEWDHKPLIRTKFISATTKSGAWHTYGSTEFFYDIWSNIHYGYVGAAAGFGENVLLDGAGLEQIGTDILRRRWPARTVGIDGLRAFDDSSDREAIGIGIALFTTSPQHVSHTQLLSSILTSSGVLATRSAGRH